MTDDESPDGLIRRTNAFFAARGAARDCPVCGNLKWASVNSAGVTPMIPFSEHGVHTSEFAAYILVCTNCGFVRAHLKDVVDGKVPLGPPDRGATR